VLAHQLQADVGQDHLIADRNERASGAAKPELRGRMLSARWATSMNDRSPGGTSTLVGVTWATAAPVCTDVRPKLRAVYERRVALTHSQPAYAGTVPAYAGTVLAGRLTAAAGVSS
jgi:hypothetical protein